MTRAEQRRYDKSQARHEQYLKSGHRALVLHVGVPLSRSKYVPHIGAKQRSKGASV